MQPLRHDDRNKQSLLWGTVTIILILIYCSSGLCISLYFGNQVEDPCSLAWKYYMGFEYTNNRPIGSYIIADCNIIFTFRYVNCISITLYYISKYY